MPVTYTSKKHPQLTTLTLWTMTIATCLVVANIYYNQPLLVDIAKTFSVSKGTAGFISTLTQLGYAAGMLFIVPLADMMKRKKLIMFTFAAVVVSLLGAAVAPTYNLMLVASFSVGAASLIPQLLVPMAAHLAKPEERGKKIGVVMGGLLIGILLSRTISGTIGDHFGWRAMYYIAAGLMLVTWLFVFLFLPEVEPDYTGTYKELMVSLIHLFKTEPKLRFAALRGRFMLCLFYGLLDNPGLFIA
jgi:predicted MFS family arabinose efflux permease